jgi:hypothetical protein
VEVKMNVYSKKQVKTAIDEGNLNPEDGGFMLGYLE